MTTGLLAAAFLTACGGSRPARPSEPYRNALFERIQVHEAGLDGAEALLRRERTCPDRCPMVEKMWFHAERICRISERADDRDAEARCELAEHRCEGATDLARRQGCGCPSHPARHQDLP